MLKPLKQREIRISFHNNFNIYTASEKHFFEDKKSSFQNLKTAFLFFKTF